MALIHHPLGQKFPNFTVFSRGVLQLEAIAKDDLKSEHSAAKDSMVSLTVGEDTACLLLILLIGIWVVGTVVGAIAVVTPPQD